MSEIRAKAVVPGWQGLKAHAHFAMLTARLKPCPGYKTSFGEFFSKL